MRSLRREISGSGIRVTAIQPGNVATPLASMARDSKGLKDFGGPSGAKGLFFNFFVNLKLKMLFIFLVLDPSDVANSVVYALEQPAHCAVNEILIEPTGEPI